MKKTALIIAPIDASEEKLRDTIKSSLNETSFIPTSMDQLIHPGQIIGQSILELIQKSDIIIVDITRMNPNVMYELGMAHALRKTTILIIEKDSATKIPSDLIGFLYIMYDKNNLSSLRDSIIRFTSRFQKEKM